MSDYSKSFGQRIHQLRIEKGLNQTQLAEVTGTRKNSVSNWENGVSTPNFADLCALADFFRVSLDYLVGRSEDPKLH